MVKKKESNMQRVQPAYSMDKQSISGRTFAWSISGGSTSNQVIATRCYLENQSSFGPGDSPNYYYFLQQRQLFQNGSISESVFFQRLVTQDGNDTRPFMMRRSADSCLIKESGTQLSDSQELLRNWIQMRNALSGGGTVSLPITITFDMLQPTPIRSYELTNPTKRIGFSGSDVPDPGCGRVSSLGAGVSSWRGARWVRGFSSCMPASFSLSGSNDGGSWSIVHSGTGTGGSGLNGQFRYYRLRITSANCPIIEFGDILFYASPDAPEPLPPSQPGQQPPPPPVEPTDRRERMPAWTPPPPPSALPPPPPPVPVYGYLPVCMLEAWSEKQYNSSIQLENRSGNQEIFSNVQVDSVRSTIDLYASGISLSVYEDFLMKVKNMYRNLSKLKCIYFDIFINATSLTRGILNREPFKLSLEERTKTIMFPYKVQIPIDSDLDLYVYMGNPTERYNGIRVHAVLFGCTPDCLTLDGKMMAVYTPCDLVECDWSFKMNQDCEPRDIEEITGDINLGSLPITGTLNSRRFN